MQHIQYDKLETERFKIPTLN